MVRVIGGSWFGWKIEHLQLVDKENLVAMGFAREREMSVLERERDECFMAHIDVFCGKERDIGWWQGCQKCFFDMTRNIQYKLRS